MTWDEQVCYIFFYEKSSLDCHSKALIYQRCIRREDVFIIFFFRTGFSLEKAKYRQLREDLRQNILPEKVKEDGFLGQYGQDLFASMYFKGKKEGTFVDIGANDGKSFSNSYVLEKKYNWNGLCVEPLPEEFEQLKKIRKCALENKCIGEQKSKAKFLVHGMLSGIVDTYDKKHLQRISREEKKSKKKGKGVYYS
ncbi:MAG: FkbM family methyltransferase [Candidatus Marinimicrobia bacterium]|nr:FkbM family methyltransferase [Candidatus Neomarinimicrobiota bacterium]